jgi:hypothetical protein
VASELLSRVIVVRLAAVNYACFQLIKELAPTAEAMKVEAQAKELSHRLFPRSGVREPTQAEFLEGLESIRALFDQLKDLPQLTPAQIADERAEGAALAQREHRAPEDHFSSPSPRQWLERELKWHRTWDHQGFLVAYSQMLDPRDHQRFKMVINLRGGIFEWNQMHAGSRSHPNSFEAKLPEADLANLKEFLTNLPPSDETGKETHYIVSYLKNGRWTTRTYNSLPAGSPFEGFLERMIRQSSERWDFDAPPGSPILKTYPNTN